MPDTARPAAREPPSRTAFSSIALAVTAVLLALSGALLLLVGLHDLLLASRDAEQVIGGVLTAAGTADLAAALWLTHPGRPWLLHAALTMGFVGGLVLLVVQGQFEVSSGMWLWGSFAAIPLVAALLDRARPAGPPSGETPGTRRSRAETAAPYAAGATVLAALIPLAGDAFRPVSGPDSLYAELRMSAAGTRTGAGGEEVAVVDTTVQVSNAGAERLIFLGGVGAVSGVRSTPRAPSGNDWPFASELEQGRRTGRFEQPQPYDVINVVFDVVTPGRYLEPGQSVTLEWRTLVPTSAYDTVEGWVIVASAYQDRMRLSEEPGSPRRWTRGGRGFFESSWTVEPTGWIAGVTRGRPILSVEYYVDSEYFLDGGRAGAPPDAAISGPLVTGVGMDYQIVTAAARAAGTSSDRSDEYSERLQTFYGAATTVDAAILGLG